jgi:hypothetical protein
MKNKSYGLLTALGLVLITAGVLWGVDAKLTALDAITSLTTDDLIYAVDDPGGSPVPKKITLANLNASLSASTIGSGTLAVARGGTGVTSIVKSVWFGASGLSVDGVGTGCDVPAEVTINSGPKIWTVLCDDSNTSTMYGSIKMPDSWNGGTVTFTHVYLQTAADTGVLNGDIACQARSNAEAPSATWGTEIAIDDAAVTGSNQNDMTTSAAVTCAGSSPAGGDMLYFRYQLDTATTTAVATLHHLGFLMEYTVTTLSD